MNSTYAQTNLCLSSTHKVDRMSFFVRRIWCFYSKGRYDSPILPPALIKLPTMMGFKISNLLYFDVFL